MVKKQTKEGVDLEWAADRVRIASRAVRLLGGEFDGDLILRAVGLELHRQRGWLLEIARKAYDRMLPE